MNALRAFTHTLRAIALHVPFSAFFASMSYESLTMLVVLIVLAHTTYEICCLHRDDAGRFFCKLQQYIQPRLINFRSILCTFSLTRMAVAASCTVRSRIRYWPLQQVAQQDQITHYRFTPLHFNFPSGSLEQKMFVFIAFYAYRWLIAFGLTVYLQTSSVSICDVMLPHYAERKMSANNADLCSQLCGQQTGHLRSAVISSMLCGVVESKLWSQPCSQDRNCSRREEPVRSSKPKHECPKQKWHALTFENPTNAAKTASP
jgi:hypothetical protein